MNLFKTHFKKPTLVLLLQLPLFSFSQAVYSEAELIEYNIKEVNIIAREYINGEIIKEVKVKNVINEYGKSTEFTTYKPDGAIKSLIKTYYIDEGRTEIDTNFREDGTIKDFRIIKESLDRSTISNYQISSANDTLVAQVRYMNKAGKDSLLITTINSKTFVSLKWEYDGKGRLEKSTFYNTDGRVRFIEKVKYENGGKCEVVTNNKGVIRERNCFADGDEVTRFYYDRTGYLYGIKLEKKHLGKRIKERNEKGLVKRVAHFDRKENILSEIIYEYNF